MLKNLIESLECAFGDDISTRMDSRSTLAIKLGGVELCINENGQTVGVSGVGAACLNVDIDGLGRVVAPARAPV